MIFHATVVLLWQQFYYGRCHPTGNSKYTLQGACAIACSLFRSLSQPAIRPNQHQIRYVSYSVISVLSSSYLVLSDDIRICLFLRKDALLNETFVSQHAVSSPIIQVAINILHVIKIVYLSANSKLAFTDWRIRNQFNITRILYAVSLRALNMPQICFAAKRQLAPFITHALN